MSTERGLKIHRKGDILTIFQGFRCKAPAKPPRFAVSLTKPHSDSPNFGLKVCMKVLIALKSSFGSSML